MSSIDAVPGPRDPAPSTPTLTAGGVRRTTTLDMTRPDGLGGRVVADVRGQDRQDDDVLARLALTIDIDPVGTVTGGDVATLVGATMRGGYGRHLAEAFGDEATRRSLRYSALEDLGGAFLVSGYAPLRGGEYTFEPEVVRTMASAQADICSGWATGTPLLESLRVGVNLVPMGPPAPAIDRGWHDLASMSPGTVRRRRRLDVVRDGEAIAATSHFRDSHAGDDGETVLHEYLVEARIDGDGRVVSIDVDPRVLPWRECPGAVASAQQVVGVTLDELTRRVRAELVGPATCTHLSSTLRGLADVAALVRMAG
jgi:hypothetical protein